MQKEQDKDNSLRLVKLTYYINKANQRFCLIKNITEIFHQTINRSAEVAKIKSLKNQILLEYHPKKK